MLCDAEKRFNAKNVLNHPWIEKNAPNSKNVLEKLKFPLLLEILGVIFTAIIQSSSAMTGIVIIILHVNNN